MKEKYEGNEYNSPFIKTANDGELNDVLILLNEDEGMDINHVGVGGGGVIAGGLPLGTGRLGIGNSGSSWGL